MKNSGPGLSQEKKNLVFFIENSFLFLRDGSGLPGKKLSFDPESKLLHIAVQGFRRYLPRIFSWN